MAVKTSWTAGDVLTAADLTDTFAAKAALSSSIIQVVQGLTSTAVTNNTNVEADTGLTATITPTKATSRILIVATQNGCSKNAGNAASALFLYLYRNTVLQASAQAGWTNTSSDLGIGTMSFAIIDSPATTSALTYKTKFKNVVNAAGVGVQGSSVTSSIILVELAAA